MNAPSPTPRDVEREPERIAYSVDEAAQAVGLGKSTLYREMSEGRLPFRKVGDRRLILRNDLLHWLSIGMEAAA